jgi:hypothetical protein
MLRTFLNSRLMSVGLAGVIAVGVLGAAGIAMAQTGPSNGSGTPGATSPDGPGPDRGDRRHIVGVGIAEIIKVSGLTKEDFQQGFKDGKSINDVLTAHKLNPADIRVKVLQDAKAKLDEAVKNNKLTQDQADKLFAGAGTMLDKLMAATPGQHGPQGNGAGPGGGGHGPQGGGNGPAGMAGKGLLDSAAKALNMSVADLQKELQSGKSIKQVADDKHIDVNTVINAMVAEASTNLHQAIENFVNSTHQPRGPKPSGTNQTPAN